MFKKKKNPNFVLSSVPKQGVTLMEIKAQMQKLSAAALPSISSALEIGVLLPATEDRRYLLRVFSLSLLN